MNGCSSFSKLLLQVASEAKAKGSPPPRCTVHAILMPVQQAAKVTSKVTHVQGHSHLGGALLRTHKLPGITMAKRQLRELRNLIPFSWDDRLEDHPVGKGQGRLR